MKLKILAASVSLISANIYAQSNTTSYWDTAQYYRSRTLAPINADAAYARGLLGQGSTIGIVDSGLGCVATNSKCVGTVDGTLKLNPAFPNSKITGMKDFTGTGMQDNIGHGTHVAGIAAGAIVPASPIQGVAPNANLVIAKVTDNGFMTVPTILQALNWVDLQGAQVANLSASISLPTNLNPTLIAPGVYATSLSNTGNLPTGLVASQWASAIPGQMVLVMAAGNEGAKTPGAQASLATATDSKGNLILGGRMIIVGNWNEQSNKMDPTSNMAGDLCAVVVKGVCQDKYTTKQFFIMAPGAGITSTVPTTINAPGYLNMSGTSMAAPAVSGAIAILHQQWPQLTGAALTQLVLTTANKNIPGYDPNIMGQGLLDLNKATQPTGGLSFMTAGNVVTGGKTTTASPILVSTSGSASTGRISSVMLVDNIGRDYYTPGQNLTATGSTGYAFNIKQASMPYTSRNNYSQLNNYTDHFASRVGDLEIGLYSDNSIGDPNMAPMMAEVSFYRTLGSATSAKFTAGSFTENNSWLGNNLSGAGPNANGSQTTFAGIDIDHKLDQSNQVYATVMTGLTNTGASNNLISSVGPIMSYTWSIGYNHTLDEKQTLGVMAYQPPTVFSGQAYGSIPVGLDANYNVVTAGSVDLSATTPEYRFGGYYKLREKSGTNVLAFIENRQNVQGVQGATSNVVGLLANVRF